MRTSTRQNQLKYLDSLTMQASLIFRVVITLLLHLLMMAGSSHGAMEAMDNSATATRVIYMHHNKLNSRRKLERWLVVDHILLSSLKQENSISSAEEVRVN